MSRNDVMLFTGMSSATDRRLEEQRKRNEQENKSKGAQIKPHAQLIIDWIEDERKLCTNIDKLVLDETNAENLQAQIIAIRMHLNFLDSLKSRTKALIRAEAKA